MGRNQMRSSEPNTVPQVYERAADRYENGLWGWVQGEFQLGNAFNMPNAIHTAAKCWENVKLCMEAITFAQHELGMFLPQWNDADGRTKGEVIDKLRELAKLYRDKDAGSE